ncbi:hypothetical protein OBBRIDRAFT_251159 [Obba rivulosa]|uniref:Uncharacterized protein n=1 Tax=Obba rivulosa TaxID=1052685 RepID=A0A8E2DFR0_9APHY|nr:hypothetical protein OBBRIDRAFT_251159 [Obba rivulosa]
MKFAAIFAAIAGLATVATAILARTMARARPGLTRAARPPSRPRTARPSRPSSTSWAPSSRTLTSLSVSAAVRSPSSMLAAGEIVISGVTRECQR